MDESMEKRILLSFALSLAVLMAFSWLFAPPPPSPEVVPETDNQVTAEIETLPAGEEIENSLPVSAESPTNPTEEAPGIAEAAFRAVEGEIPPEQLRAERIEQFLIDTPQLGVRISNEGARLESVQLRNYVGPEGDPLELIGQDVGQTVGWPLAILTGDSAIDEAIETALFVADQSENSVQLRYRSEGLQVVKEFRFG